MIKKTGLCIQSYKGTTTNKTDWWGAVKAMLKVYSFNFIYVYRARSENKQAKHSSQKFRIRKAN